MEFKIKGAALVRCIPAAGETEVVVPRGIRIIEWGAFSLCGMIKRVVLPDGIFEIRRAAFQNCRRLMQINLPERLRLIGESAFSGCEKLQSVIMPDTVKELGQSAFENCTSLVQLRLSKNISRIDSRAFYNCKKLQKVYIPDSVKEIGQSAFQQCSELMQVRCPDSMIAIEERAFRGCGALRQIKMPEKLQQLGNQCFMNCSRLTALSLPEGIVRLPDEVCRGCGELMQIVVPDSLEHAVSYCAAFPFAGCEKLKSAILRGGLCHAAYRALDNIPGGLERVYVIDFERYEKKSGFEYLVLKTYLEEKSRFSAETQQRYDGFIRRNALQISDLVIEWHEMMEHICKRDLLEPKDMANYLHMAFERSACLNQILRYVCGKKKLEKQSISQLLDCAIAIEHSEATAMLLDYQHRYYPTKDEEDDDPFFLPSLDDF